MQQVENTFAGRTCRRVQLAGTGQLSSPPVIYHVTSTTRDRQGTCL